MKYISALISIFLCSLAYSMESKCEEGCKEYYESGKLQKECTLDEAAEWPISCTTYYEDGKKSGEQYYGSYSEGPMEYSEYQYYASGKLLSSTYFKGRLSAIIQEKVYYESGKLKSEEETWWPIGSRYHGGHRKTYYEDGTLLANEGLNDRSPYGTCKYYNSNGKLKATLKYEYSIDDDGNVHEKAYGVCANGIKLTEYELYNWNYGLDACKL
jgi:antitoxin component YwqK of YwqJK toxin-antitoxin module